MSKVGVVEEEVDWVVHIYCAIYWPNIVAELLYVVSNGTRTIVNMKLL